MQQLREFRLSPRRRRLVTCCIVFFIALPAVLVIGGLSSGEGALLATGAIVALIMAPFAVYLWVCISYPKITLSSDGIAVKGSSGGFSSFLVPWTNIQRLRLSPGSEALILHESLATPALARLRDWSGVSYSGAPLYDSEQQALIAEQRYVPLDAYADWFEQGTLLDAVREFAPALVENFTQDRARAREEGVKSKQLLIVIFAITGVVLIIVILAGIFGSNLSPEAKLRWSEAERGVLIVLGWIGGMGLMLYAALNLRAAYIYAKARRVGMMIMWLTMGVVQVGLALLLIASQYE